MKHLERNFTEFSALLTRRMDEDPDFRALCADYERVADTIEYLGHLVAAPRESLRKQIEQASRLAYPVRQAGFQTAGRQGDRLRRRADVQGWQ